MFLFILFYFIFCHWRFGTETQMPGRNEKIAYFTKLKVGTASLYILFWFENLIRVYGVLVYTISMMKWFKVHFPLSLSLASYIIYIYKYKCGNLTLRLVSRFKDYALKKICQIVPKVRSYSQTFDEFREREKQLTCMLLVYCVFY